MTLVIEGSVGSALAVKALLAKEIENGDITIDMGSWLDPVKVYNIDRESANAVRQIIQDEWGCMVLMYDENNKFVG